MDDSLELIRSCPPFSKDLLDYLNAMIPAKCPSIGDSERAIWMYVGKRELVEFLKKRHEDMENNMYRHVESAHSILNRD